MAGAEWHGAIQAQLHALGCQHTGFRAAIREAIGRCSCCDGHPDGHIGLMEALSGREWFVPDAYFINEAEHTVVAIEVSDTYRAQKVWAKHENLWWAFDDDGEWRFEVLEITPEQPLHHVNLFARCMNRLAPVIGAGGFTLEGELHPETFASIDRLQRGLPL